MHLPIAAMHCSSVMTDYTMLLLSQCRYNCLSSAKACNVTPYSIAIFARSAVYSTNRSGPKTEPYGTEHMTVIEDDVSPE